MSSGVPISSPTAAVEQPSVSDGLLGSGRFLTALVPPFLLFDGITKVMRVSALLAKGVRLGLSENLATGVTLLLSTVVEAIPRTSILGAILLQWLSGRRCLESKCVSDIRASVKRCFRLILACWCGLDCISPKARLRGLVPLRS